jgi:hypothetical protein
MSQSLPSKDFSSSLVLVKKYYENKNLKEINAKNKKEKLYKEIVEKVNSSF